jgi:hypothetical protein
MLITVQFPPSDNALLAWSTNFKNLITADPSVYGLTATLATAYGVVHTAYADALAACDPNVRNKAAVVAKNAARTTLKTQATLLANTIYGTPTVTVAQKVELGIPPRSEPNPIPPPSTSPVLEVVSTNAWTARIRLKAGAGGGRGKPAGTFGASVFSYVGATAPTDIGSWKFEGSTGRVTAIDVDFPNTLAAGTKVWLTAFWFNGRKQSGPACAPVSCNLPGGSVSLAA